MAARVAGELAQTLVKRSVDVVGPGDDRPVGLVDRVRGVDHLHHISVSAAQALIGRLELRAEVRDRTVAAADTVEVRQQRSGGGGDPLVTGARRGDRVRRRRIRLVRDASDTVLGRGS